MEAPSYTMADGTEAWLSASGNYFIRRFRLTPKLRKEVPEADKWDGIAYYNKFTMARIRLANGYCSTCKEELESLHCGHYVTCSCGDSAVDTDRWYPERHRYIGKVKKHEEV